MEELPAQQLIRLAQEGFFQSRYDCEDDPLVIQPIPYVLVFDENRKVFSYVRADNITDYGDPRLFGKHSIGVGGHVKKSDAPDYIMNCLKREVTEEIGFTDKVSRPTLIGTLFQPDTPVDEVHFGLVYAIQTDKDVRPRESSISSGRMIQISEVTGDPQKEQKYETWSRVLLPHLDEIYDRVKP